MTTARPPQWTTRATNVRRTWRLPCIYSVQMRKHKHRTGLARARVASRSQTREKWYRQIEYIITRTIQKAATYNDMLTKQEENFPIENF